MQIQINDGNAQCFHCFISSKDLDDICRFLLHLCCLVLQFVSDKKASITYTETLTSQLKSRPSTVEMRTTNWYDYSLYPKAFSTATNAVSSPSLLPDGRSTWTMNEKKSSSKTIRKLQQTKDLNQITVAFLIIVLTFAVCWIPRGVANIWTLLRGRSSVPLALEIVSTLLIFTTPAADPVVYGYYRTDMRNAFRNTLFGAWVACPLSVVVQHQHSFKCAVWGSDGWKTPI